MRILHLLKHTQHLGGNVHAAIDLACAQSMLGHEVAIGSGGGDFDELFARHGIQHFHIPQAAKVGPLFEGTRALNKVVRNWKPDIIHAHMMTSAVIAWPLCLTSRAKLVSTVHNEFQQSAVLMGLADRVIAVSESVSASMAKRGIPKSRLRVVLNGTIGAARLENRRHEVLPLERPAIAYVGGLHPRKGLPDLLAAFDIVSRDHPEARLYVAGDGPFMEAYSQQAKSLDCSDAIKMLGPLENPFALLEAADIFVLPSHADPAPLVLSEAREAGCAIVATNVDGVGQMLENGKAGILVPPLAPAELARAISSILVDEATLSEWKRHSQINIDHMKIERVAKETVAIYSEIALH